MNSTLLTHIEHFKNALLFEIFSLQIAQDSLNDLVDCCHDQHTSLLDITLLFQGKSLPLDSFIVHASSMSLTHFYHQGSKDEDVLSLLKILHKADYPLDKVDERGHCLSHWASHLGYAKTLTFLIEEGVNMETPNGFGKTLLHFTAIEGHLNLMQTLVSHSVDLHTRDPKGYDALHLAIQYGWPPMVRFLVEAGSDLFLKNGNQHDALKAAQLLQDKSIEHAEISNYLQAVSLAQEEKSTLLKSTDRSSEKDPLLDAIMNTTNSFRL